MKLQKGLLDDFTKPAETGTKAVKPEPQPAPTPTPQPIEVAPVVVEKDRLFQTLKEETGSERNYLKLLGIVAIVVAIVGGIVFYLTLPGVGDQIRGSKDLEAALRSHFLDKEKRTATDITFYQCDKFFWARVGVEARTDIPGNPLAKVERYAAKAVPNGDNKWDITAVPVTSPEIDTPCR